MDDRERPMIACDPLPVPQLDLAQDCFVVGAPRAAAVLVHDPATWRRLWPGLALSVRQDRGAEGIRWTVDGPLFGSAEVWLESYADGVVVHCYLRCDVAGSRLRPAAALRRKRRWQRRLWRALWQLKDDLEGDRPPGTAPATAPAAVKTRPAGAET